MNFEELKLHRALLETVLYEGYQTPTPIQAAAIPHVLAGRDVLGCAQTGTGKTAAFALPILQRLTRTPRRDREPRVLVLVPTRELAGQVGDSFTTYGRGLGTRCAVVFGGVGQRAQVAALRAGVDVLVATPGRLLDLYEQHCLRLDSVEVLVLDEADRMLDMGFIKPIRRILGELPPRRQNLLFSATMPPAIRSLAAGLLKDPAEVSVTPVASTAPLIEQRVCFVRRAEKPDTLTHVLSQPDVERAIVFTRTKHGADKLARKLARSRIVAEVIHGNKSQNARLRALSSFRDGTVRVLVATDVVARGIDVDAISHVVNYDVPNDPESYVHRIGRTGRAGAAGQALSLCDDGERAFLRDIERLTKKPMAVIEPPKAPAGFTPKAPAGFAPGANPEGVVAPARSAGRAPQTGFAGRPSRAPSAPYGSRAKPAGFAPRAKPSRARLQPR